MPLIQYRWLLLSLALVLLLGHKAVAEPVPTLPESTQIYVINNGWHTGLIVPAAPFQQRFPALKQRFTAAQYLEIGWGDKGFYQAKEISATIALKAMFGLSGSIMHLVAIPDTPQAYFPASEIKSICLSDTQLKKLNAAIGDSLALGPDQDVQALGPGLYGDSEFYAAVGAYHLLNTCNSWTAQRLARAGLPIWSRFKLTAASVMNAIADLPGQCLPE